MNATAKALWLDLVRLLDDRNLLPANAATMTPSELVREVVKSSGDARIRSFVEDYYYPRHFGGETSGMTDAQARDLFEWIAAGLKQAEFPPASPVREAMEREKLCEVCHHRPAETAQDLQNAHADSMDARSPLSLFQKGSR